MYHQVDEPEFPNWWDILDETSEGSREIRDAELNENSAEGVVLSPAEDRTEHDRVAELASVHYRVESSRGYEREIIENVWNFAEVIPGNDPDLWRKDEGGNWIRRLDYGRRDSEFGWEIFDPGIGRHSQGVYAMRPMQWGKFLEQFEVFG